jgi:hypothetical protein
LNRRLPSLAVNPDKSSRFAASTDDPDSPTNGRLAARTGPRVSPSANPIETFMATVSVLWCLPQGRVEHDSEAVGTLIRPERFKGIARDASWSDHEILAIAHRCWRFYRLVK